MENFDIEKQWQLYLQHIDLDEKTIDTIRLRDTKRAFVAGITNFFQYLEIATQNLNNDDGTEAMAKLLHDLNKFWEHTRFWNHTADKEFNVYVNGFKINE